MKVINEIQHYEINGDDKAVSEKPFIIIENHWNRHDFVVLVVDGIRFTVSATDLRKAVDNAANH